MYMRYNEMQMQKLIFMHDLELAQLSKHLI